MRTDFGCRVATFWELAAYSVDHMVSLYFDYLILVISRFGFEGWIWVLIASVPDLCILFTFMLSLKRPLDELNVHVLLISTFLYCTFPCYFSIEAEGIRMTSSLTYGR